MPGRDLPLHAPPSDLGAIVRRRREQARLSLREAARRIGISSSYLMAIEKGRNPTTGRAPTPSPRILAAITRVLDVDMATLLAASGAAAPDSVHLLLYQTGPAPCSPIKAARAVFAGRVDAWIEIVDPDGARGDLPRPNDVVVSSRAPLGPVTAGSVFEMPRVLDHLSDVLAGAARSSPPPRLGIIFGAHSRTLRSVDNPGSMIACERTWESDVGALCRATLGDAPAANVCVYREADLQELAPRLDPLGAVVDLLETHPLVAVEDGQGHVTTGPAAIEAILTGARPSGVSAKTWETLARAAAAGLAAGVRRSTP